MTIRSATYIGTVALLSQLLLAHGCGSNNPSTIAAAGTTGTAGAAAGTPSAGTTGVAGAMAGTPSAMRQPGLRRLASFGVETRLGMLRIASVGVDGDEVPSQLPRRRSRLRRT